MLQKGSAKKQVLRLFPSLCSRYNKESSSSSMGFHFRDCLDCWASLKLLEQLPTPFIPRFPFPFHQIILSLPAQIFHLPFPSQASTIESEMAVPEVNKKLLEQLEDMGFPRVRATRAIHYSGNSGLEEAINWFVDHENDSNIDEMPLVAVDIDVDRQTFHITEQMRIKAQELRDQVRKKKEEEEKKMERIRASKELTEAKQTAEANERKRYLVSWKAEEEDEKRARERILKKLDQDKVERRFRVGLPSERPAALKSSPLQGKTNSVPVKSVIKAEQLRECLRSLNHNHKDEGTTVERAFQTLLIYVGNVAKNPDEEKFRKIRLSNPLFQDRVGNLSGGLEFLELCGFEKTTEGEFLYLSRDKVDMTVLNTAGYELKSAMTNPFFGVLSR